MRGNRATIKDIELELSELVMPANLLSNESLSPDDTPEEEQVSPFKVDSLCEHCNNCIRICVIATTGGIRLLEQLLLASQLSFLCPGCARTTVRHGRPH
ncbi:E7 [Gammapapillomavirus sp.]|uniref:Protein E7 n=1 Tax=Human papillomavirus TaxID=10566 RepID=A0A385PNX9_9PAPI|nr:E7 [Gammapapillomavirus sp.]AYA93552.1 MAG: E7 protein [Human papillomavirus]